MNISEMYIFSCTNFMYRFLFPCQPDLCWKCRLKIWQVKLSSSKYSFFQAWDMSRGWTLISDVFFNFNDYMVPEEHYFLYIVLDIQNLLDLFYWNIFRHLYVWLTKKKYLCRWLSCISIYSPLIAAFICNF